MDILIVALVVTGIAVLAGIVYGLRALIIKMVQKLRAIILERMAFHVISARPRVKLGKLCDLV